MKLVLVCFAFCVSALVKETVAHSVCATDFVRLKVAADKDECQKKCTDFTNPRKGKCFAFVYAIKDETCDGYVFDHARPFTKFEKCGANPGILVDQPEAPDSDQNAAEPGELALEFNYDDRAQNDGCELVEEDLGIAASKKECKKLCTELAEDLLNYAGCAAWFWSPSDQACKGALFERAANENVCGSV